MNIENEFLLLSSFIASMAFIKGGELDSGECPDTSPLSVV